MKISVIIPVYNKQRYLKALLHQIQTQTFTDYECLLIDDGSTDASGAICDRFAAQDYRFRVFHIPNGGVSHARNVGLDHAAGEFITFIDGDDEIHPEYLENLYRCMERSGADLVIGSFQKFRDCNDIQEIFCHPAGVGCYSLNILLPDFANVQRKTGFYGYCWAKLFPSSLIQDIRFDESIRLAEDFDFYLRIYPLIQTVYLDDKPFYRYRQEAENSSVQIRDDQIDYVTQLRINLRYRVFLYAIGAYSGDNREIVDKHTNNYLYFSLFHCPYEMLDARFDELVGICREQRISPKGDTLMQKVLMHNLRHGAKQNTKFFLRVYRTLRTIRNALKGM